MPDCQGPSYVVVAVTSAGGVVVATGAAVSDALGMSASSTRDSCWMPTTVTAVTAKTLPTAATLRRRRRRPAVSRMTSMPVDVTESRRASAANSSCNERLSFMRDLLVVRVRLR